MDLLEHRCLVYPVVAWIDSSPLTPKACLGPIPALAERFARLAPYDAIARLGHTSEEQEDPRGLTLRPFGKGRGGVPRSDEAIPERAGSALASHAHSEDRPTRPAADVDDGHVGRTTLLAEQDLEIKVQLPRGAPLLFVQPQRQECHGRSPEREHGLDDDDRARHAANVTPDAARTAVKS